MTGGVSMQGDQASGLRQWSRRGEAVSDSPSPALVVMGWSFDEKTPETLAQRLALPEGAHRWQPQPLVLSQTLPDTVPESPWWVLQLPDMSARSAPALAGALRTLYQRGMPQTILLAAPDRLAAAGLVSAAHEHLGVTLLQDVTAWQQAVMARLNPY